MLTIEAAEELQRLNKNINTNLKFAKELSELLQEEFTWRLDYSLIFSKAYFQTYSTESQLSIENSKQYLETISKNLEYPSALEHGELEKLIDFCVKLSDYAAIQEQEIRKLRSHSCLL